MKITPDLFEAFSKCPTKCWLQAAGEPSFGNAYAEWVKSQNASYRATATERLISETPKEESALSLPPENLKASKWCLAASQVMQAQRHPCVVESNIHAVERVPSDSQGKPIQFIPIRSVFTNKIGKDEKLLLAFDAFMLSETLGCEISNGKIIHGDSHAILKVKISAMADKMWKRIENITTLLSSPALPDLVLNRHCTKCEFQTRCRQKAIEKDDLSLLAGMSEKERKKLHSKGIFTVTQLSYTFRPRRRTKRLRNKREKYHHSLKALAIREKKIYIVGSPELKIEGTPVCLDVEGLPDRDFYYLIGVRIGNGESAVQHRCIHLVKPDSISSPFPAVTHADSLASQGTMFPKFSSPIEALEAINKAASWDYQRDRIYIRTDKQLKRSHMRSKSKVVPANHINRECVFERPRICPYCGRIGESAYKATRILYDLRFSRFGVRRWTVRYRFHYSYCQSCHRCFGKPKEFWEGTHYARNVVALLVFKIIELCESQRAAAQDMNTMFRLGISDRQVYRLKVSAAKVFEETRQSILLHMVKGTMIHADETRINLHGKSAYV